VFLELMMMMMMIVIVAHPKKTQSIEMGGKKLRRAQQTMIHFKKEYTNMRGR